MQRRHKVLSIGLIVALAGLSAVLAIHTDQKPARADEQAEQPPREVARPPADRVAQPEKPQIEAGTIRVQSGTTNRSPPTLDDLSRWAKANPKGPISPEHLAAHRAEERIIARREYGTLFEMLQVSPQQEEDFLDVIVADGVAQPSIEELRANRAKWARERTEKLSAIVGYEKAPIFEDYLHNLEEHTRVARIGMQLDAAGAPLSKEQKTYLVQLLVAERERVPQPSTQKPIMTTADIEREIAWMEDQDRRVREGAASMLSSRQHGYLDEVLAARLARRRVGLYMIPVVSTP